MCNKEIFDIIIDSLSIIVSICTLILVWIGLRTWKIQLKGENFFKLSLDVLRELKLTLVAIEEYRYPFYPANEIYAAFIKHNNGKILDFMNDEDRKLAKKCTELERWNKIVEQFNVYNDTLLKLVISINNYDIDLVNGKRLKDYVIEMNQNRSRREFADDEREQLDFTNKDERNKLKEEYLDINKILIKHNKDDDIWGIRLEQYFEEVNKRLRKYLK
jgi:hypothetical protein